MTSANTSGEGWSCEGDASEGTLTLTEANITGAYTYNEQYGYTANIYAGEGLTLTVVLNGENTVDDSSVFVGICSDGPALTLKGGGRLTAKGSSL